MSSPLFSGYSAPPRDICIHNTEIAFTSLVDTVGSGLNMVKIEGGFYKRDLTLNEVDSTGGGPRKVGILRRKASGKTYESPRIVLDSHFKGLIGRHFDTYLGRATLTSDFHGSIYREHGDCLILFFADEKT